MMDYSYAIPDATTHPRLVFDVDGVLADHRNGLAYGKRPPYPWVSEKLKRLREKGFYIVLQTARYMKKCNGSQEGATAAGYEELFNWCLDWDIPFDELYLGKASGVMYIDDRGFQVRSDKGEEDWNMLFKILNVEQERG